MEREGHDSEHTNALGSRYDVDTSLRRDLVDPLTGNIDRILSVGAVLR